MNKIKKLLILGLVQMLACVAVAQMPRDPRPLSDSEHELKGGETHSYRISLTSNQFFYALVEQLDIDVTTAVFAPDGKQLTESNSPNDRWGTEPILFVARVSGEFRVDIRATNSKVPPGRYRIKLIAQREATSIDKTHALAQAAFDEA